MVDSNHYSLILLIVKCLILQTLKILQSYTLKELIQTGGLTWNVGAWWDNSEFDDVGYLNAVIDSVISNFAIDSNRIYACGMSTGGFMTYELACELSNRIVAFGSVAGNFRMNTDQDCTNEREIPIMHIHGKYRCNC